MQFDAVEDQEDHVFFDIFLKLCLAAVTKSLNENNITGGVTYLIKIHITLVNEKDGEGETEEGNGRGQEHIKMLKQTTIRQLKQSRHQDNYTTTQWKTETTYLDCTVGEQMKHRWCNVHQITH